MPEMSQGVQETLRAEVSATVRVAYLAQANRELGSMKRGTRNPTGAHSVTVEGILEARTIGRDTKVVNILRWKPGTVQKKAATKFANAETTSGTTSRRNTG